MINPHELTVEPQETFFSFELDGAGVPRPTLWDANHPEMDLTRAVCLTTDNGITITTDPEIVEAFLDSN